MITPRFGKHLLDFDLERRGGLIGHLLPPGRTSKGNPQPVQEQKGAGREGEAKDHPGRSAEKLFEYDKNRCAEP